MCCNVILSILEVNYYSDYKNTNNVYFLWIVIRQNYKLKGSNSLNNRFRRLSLLKLSDYKNVFEYAEKFKELHNKIRTIYKKLRLNDVYLIFLFYIELDKEYKNYFLYYTQTHDTINAIEKFAFTLKYVTQRFIQIVINSSISRIELILELIVTRFKVYVVTNTTNQTTQRSQSRAIEEPDVVYLRRLVKFC